MEARIISGYGIVSDTRWERMDALLPPFVADVLFMLLLREEIQSTRNR